MVLDVASASISFTRAVAAAQILKYLLHVFCCVCFVFTAHCANDDHYCQHLGFKVLLASTSSSRNAI
ncbi:hypothetical protein T01_14140 [Trichinella spiralis]|uniref:Uncharacterized protein n=1 Tax=Trichinella spiralis TaxID=6334 RepID=A0A0V1BCV3_TRISP|nr:hypothetical protein T01_14140 [Trichinella spiralis]